MLSAGGDARVSINVMDCGGAGVPARALTKKLLDVQKDPDCQPR
ncbi:MAG: hypothetical protein JWN74_265 [Acidobacteriaceae bacterium]|nr:hypothetical protein [Acidobacteriaceae bacterium]